METAGHLIGVVVEFAAGVEHGHDDLGGGTAFFRMDIHRNAAAVVGYGHRLVAVDSDGDLAAIAGQGLVDGIVHDLEHHMVQAGAIVRIADVHARALADSVQTPQDFDVR